MNLFMMYMVGSSISIFPIMMVGMMFVRPIRALFSMNQSIFSKLIFKQVIPFKYSIIFFSFQDVGGNPGNWTNPSLHLGPVGCTGACSLQVPIHGPPPYSFIRLAGFY